MRSHEVRGRFAVRAITAAVALMGSLMLFSPARSAAPPSVPRVAGALSRFPSDVARAAGVADLRKATDGTTDSGVGIVSTKLDRLYQLFNLTEGPHAGALLVAERSLADFGLLRTVIIPDRHAHMANGSTGAEWVTALDGKGDRLYIAYQGRDGFVGYAGAVQGDNLPGLVNLDLRNFTYVDDPFPRFAIGTGGVAFRIAGLQYEEAADRLLLLEAASNESAALANSLGLVGWSKEELGQGRELEAKRPRPVRSCRRDPINDSTSSYLTPMLIAPAPDLQGDGTVKRYVMFPCYSSAFSTNVVIARMESSSALDPTSTQEQAVVAPAGISNWIVDPVHGRMFLTNTSSETDTWVYEAASNAFVGIIAMSPRGVLEASALSMGLDEESGRLYARTLTNGLMITEAAQDPVPQADVFPKLAAGGGYRLLVDQKRNRVLSLTGTSVGFDSAPDHYEIIAVPPVRPIPPREDPDVRTVQAAEQPGRTVAQFGGNASAYGLRVLLARGISGAAPSNGNDTAGDLYKNVNSYCGFTDRELILGRVSKTELSDTSRFARAAAVDLDNASVVDLGTPSRCDVYNSYQGSFFPVNAVLPFLNTIGLLHSLDANAPEGAAPSLAINDQIGPHTRWDYRAADCSTPEGADDAGPNSSPLTGTTKVDCTKDDTIAGQAEGKLSRTGDALAISVSRASGSTSVTRETSVTRDPKTGLVAKATARVEGLRIGDISIGYIANSATASAYGRTGSAKTAFPTPKIGFVEGPGLDTCADNCNLDRVIKQFNSVLAGRAELRRITPESRLAHGSPGGYQAGIIKSEKQKASDNSLSGDKSDEIPALELVVYNDNSVIGRARQVYQFAGVRVDSHYGIQAITQGSPCSDCTISSDTNGDTLHDIAGTVSGVTANAGSSSGEAPSSGGNPVMRFFRQIALGVINGLRVLFTDPRQALLMATVWGLMAAPFLAARRRRLLRDLGRGR